MDTCISEMDDTSAAIRCLPRSVKECSGRTSHRTKQECNRRTVCAAGSLLGSVGKGKQNREIKVTKDYVSPAFQL